MISLQCQIVDNLRMCHNVNFISVGAKLRCIQAPFDFRERKHTAELAFRQSNAYILLSAVTTELVLR